MATVIKMEPDSDSETEQMSPQLTSELARPDDGATPFIFVPVQSEVKVENDALPFLEKDEEEITVHVTPIKQELEEEENETFVDEHGVMQFVTAHDQFSGLTATTHMDSESSSFTLNSFDNDFHPPSSHSLLQTSLKKDRTLHRNRPVQITCEVCGKCFKFPCDFKRHSLMHTGERMFKCDECQKRFKLLNHLKMHIYRFHAGERHYPCDTCGKRYASVTDLKCHSRIHSSERLHVCPICNKGFFSARELRTHMQTHTGEKPFECDICKRKFLRRVHLEKHILRHMLKRQHECHDCNKKLKFLDQQSKKK